MIARSLILAIFITGLAGLVASRNLVKKTYALAIMNSAVVLLFVFEGAGSAHGLPCSEGRPAMRRPSSTPYRRRLC